MNLLEKSKQVLAQVWTRLLNILKAGLLKLKETCLALLARISCNNDKALGSIIAEAYEKVGKDGVVLNGRVTTEDTHVELVDGVQVDCGLTSPHFVTNTDKHLAELDNPYVLVVSSEKYLMFARKIQSQYLEHVIKRKGALYL